MKKLRNTLGVIISVIALIVPHSVHYATNHVNTMEQYNLPDTISTLVPEEMIDTLSMEELESQDSIVRCPEMEEDMHTVIYDCADGNHIAYIFQYPVKYIDEFGKIKDISTTIRPTQTIDLPTDSNNDNFAQLLKKYAFTSFENEIKIFYPSDFLNEDSQILAVSSDWKIGLSPYTKHKENTVMSLISDGVSSVNTNEELSSKGFSGISYSNIFDSNVSMSYHTTYTGYKELVEIKSPGKSNIFQFKLDSNGLIPEIDESGEIFLFHPETKEIVGSFAQLYVYDSAKEPAYTLNNSYEILPLDDDSYIITMKIDKEFLNSDTTKYPVIVDPTFSFTTSSAIIDAPIYSGRPSNAHGMNYYNSIGYLDSNYANGSLLVKFPALRDSAFFNSLTNSRINSVTFHTKKVGGGNAASANISAYRYTGSSWSESTVTYNSANINYNTGSFVDSANLTSNQWYSFNITSAAIAWKNGNANYDSGLLFKNTTSTTDSSYHRVLASVNYGVSVDSSYMPYVTVVFNSNNISSGFLSANLAAKDFAQAVYSSTEYTLIEYGATIYLQNNKYYYYNVHAGQPHSCTMSTSVPYGATYVGYVHTHPNSENFSDADIGIANNYGDYAYVVTKSHRLLQYYKETGITSTLYTNLTIYPLTDNEKTALVANLSNVWYGHLENGHCPIGWGCEYKTWPNE